MLRTGKQLDMSREVGVYESDDRKPHILKTIGVLGQTKKGRNIQTDRKQNSLGDKGLGSRQKKVGKSWTLWCLNIIFFSLYSHYNKTSPADKKYPSGTNTMTLCIKTKQRQKSLLLLEMWSWTENQEIRSETLPSPVNILPIHFYTPYNQLFKETQGRYSLSLPAHFLRAYWKVVAER